MALTWVKIANLKGPKGDIGTWDMGVLAQNTNLNTLTTPGRYRADTSTIAGSVTNKPSTATTQPFTVEVIGLSVVNGVYFQEFTQYDASGPIVFRRISLSGTFGAWAVPGWDKGLLVTGADLDALTTPGRYQASTSTVAKSIVNRPPGVSQPFGVEVAQLSQANNIVSQEATVWDAAGPQIFRRISLSGTFQPWQKGQSIADPSRTRLTTVGDSLTEGGDINGAWPGSASWPAQIQSYLPGVTVTNFGRSGDTTDEMMIRAGAMQVWFTVTGGSIPASGSVGLTTSQPVSKRDNRTFSGTLAGVAGTLSTGTAGAWTFTRTTTGTAVAVTGKQLFTTATPGYGTDTLVFWGGRNDVSFGIPGKEQTIADHVVAQHHKFLEWVTPQTKNVVFAGVTTASTEHAGDTAFKTIKEINDRLRSMHPGRFADVQNYLVTRAMTDMGLTPTSADTAAVAAGEIPPQLYAPGDTIHFSQATAAALAQYLFAPYLLGKGWL